jgi:hypothetical protein
MVPVPVRAGPNKPMAKKLVIALEQAPEELLATTIHNHWSPYWEDDVFWGGMGPPFIARNCWLTLNELDVFLGGMGPFHST